MADKGLKISRCWLQLLNGGEHGIFRPSGRHGSTILESDASSEARSPHGRYIPGGPFMRYPFRMVFCEIRLHHVVQTHSTFIKICSRQLVHCRRILSWVRRCVFLIHSVVSLFYTCLEQFLFAFVFSDAFSSLKLQSYYLVIHVGETFTAYLGALNVSKSLNVTKLTCTAQLQTPSQRWHLASTLDEYV